MGVNLLLLILISLLPPQTILTHILQFEKFVAVLLDVVVSVGVDKIELYLQEGTVDLERSPALFVRFLV